MISYLENQYFSNHSSILQFKSSITSLKKIVKIYGKYEIQRLLSTKRKDGERVIGAGRHFKLDVKDRLLMHLVYYYRLYITYKLSSFLFNLDQNSICRDI